jgi:hypothetical protein
MQNNALVDFLAAYGPTSDGNNMYDEFVVNAAGRAGVEPIEIGEGRSAGIVADLEGLPGRSVVLTGTAGDGKTYTARKVLSLLGKNPAPVLDEITHHQLENGRRVVFVKDLSEVSEDTKAVLVPRMVASFSSPDPSEVFVLCVNDGTLLRSWEAHSGGSEEGAAILPRECRSASSTCRAPPMPRQSTRSSRQSAIIRDGPTAATTARPMPPDAAR